MQIPGFPALISGRAEMVFPAVTIDRADIGGYGGYYGYVMPGGYAAEDLGGVSGGSLSGTLVPGYVMDSVASYGSLIRIMIVGNCEALLSGVTAMMDNGTPIWLTGPFVYYGGEFDVTIAETTTNPWSSTGNRTIQLV